MPTMQILCMKKGWKVYNYIYRFSVNSPPFSPDKCPPSFVPASAVLSEVEMPELHSISGRRYGEAG